MGIRTTGTLDNSAGGTIAAGGDLGIEADNFDNAGGSATATGALSTHLRGALDNRSGTLGVLIPAYLWLLTDIWQWTPLNRRLRFVVLGAMVGVIAGAFFTTHTWLTETRSSMLRRIVTTAAVVTTCIAVVVFAREYLGRVLPG